MADIGSVLVVVRHTYNRPHTKRRSVNIGVVSSIKKGWKLIERDFRLVPGKDKLIGRFTDTSPWGGIFDGIEFRTFEGIDNLRYHMQVHPIDLFSD